MAELDQPNTPPVLKCAVCGQVAHGPDDIHIYVSTLFYELFTYSCSGECRAIRDTQVDLERLSR